MGCWLKGWDFVPPFFVPKNSEAREMVKLYRGYHKNSVIIILTLM